MESNVLRKQRYLIKEKCLKRPLNNCVYVLKINKTQLKQVLIFFHTYVEQWKVNIDIRYAFSYSVISTFKTMFLPTIPQAKISGIFSLSTLHSSLKKSTITSLVLFHTIRLLQILKNQFLSTVQCKS